MASDGLVSARMVVRALTRLQHQGSKPLLQELETHEPELAEFVMEQLGELHQRLWAAGINRRTSQRLYRDIEKLVLTAISARREGQLQFLEDLQANDQTKHPDVQTSHDKPNTDNEQ